MHVRTGEIVHRTIKRHLTPYLFYIIGMGILALPVYIVIFFIADALSGDVMFWLIAFVSFFLGIIVAIFSIDYLLDKLVVTNKRVIWVNWKSLFQREEHEVELEEIQDIKTKEKGILSNVPFFDYGFISIETSASNTSITFKDCPNPEEVKHFILAQMK